MNKYFTILFILIISSIHFLYINRIEKRYIAQHFFVSLRPNEDFTNINENNKFACLGFPSGHVESITILCLLLNHFNVIDTRTTIISILVTALQRIVTKKHTIEQTIFGFLFGFLYSMFYSRILDSF